MSATWHDDDEELRLGGVKGALRAKTRFSFTEVKMLLEAVKRNRYVILRKFNQGVSADAKKQTWVEITEQINGLGENHREVRQIMKKWADLKCDGKRRIAALRGPNGTNLRKKKLGPVERMVHKILMMSPRGDGDSDLDFEEEDLSKLYSKGPPSSPSPSSQSYAYSYLSLTDSSRSLPGGASLDFSPLSSPEKELGGDPFHSSSDFDVDLPDDGEPSMDFEENDNSTFSSLQSSLPPPASTSLDPLPDDALLRNKPVHTYSRNSSQNQNQNSKPPPGPSSSSVASTSSGFPTVSESNTASSSAAPPPSQCPITASSSSSLAPPPPHASPSSSLAANDSTSQPTPSSTSTTPPPPPPAASPVTSVQSSNSHRPPTSSVLPPKRSSSSGLNTADPLPVGGPSHRAHDHVAKLASQSVQQQQASRMLLTSVSHSLEVLAQSVQLLVETQQEFVQESLLLQRETVDILKDFSNTALTMLRDKSNSGPAVTRHHSASHF